MLLRTLIFAFVLIVPGSAAFHFLIAAPLGLSGWTDWIYPSMLVVCIASLQRSIITMLAGKSRLPLSNKLRQAAQPAKVPTKSLLLVDSARPFARATGIRPPGSTGTIIISRCFVEEVSDEALRFALAHEHVHNRQQHVTLLLLLYFPSAAALPPAGALAILVSLMWTIEFIADHAAARAGHGSPALLPLKFDLLHPPLALRAAAVRKLSKER